MYNYIITHYIQCMWNYIHNSTHICGITFTIPHALYNGKILMNVFHASTCLNMPQHASTCINM